MPLFFAKGLTVPNGRPAAPLAPKIVAANGVLLARIDIDDPLTQCWACRGEDRSLEKAHVVAFSDGGSNDPSNYWLLCPECHREQPDNALPEAQVLWLLNHKTEIAELFDYVAGTIEQLRAMSRAEGREAIFLEWWESLGGKGMDMIASRMTSGGRITRDGFRNAVRTTLLHAFGEWVHAKKLEALTSGRLPFL